MMMDLRSAHSEAVLMKRTLLMHLPSIQVARLPVVTAIYLPSPLNPCLRHPDNASPLRTRQSSPWARKMGTSGLMTSLLVALARDSVSPTKSMIKIWLLWRA